MTSIIQPSMAGGEVSPQIGARVDLGKRAVAVEKAENFVATFTGAMMSRPGTRFVARAKPGAGPYRIVEFEFNDSQTFVLELGDAYMRFHALGAQILDSASIKTITGATAADPVVVTSTAHGLSNGDEVYITGVAGMTELNGRNFLVANVAANTFELQDLNGNDIDGSGYTAYTSGGTATPPYEIVTPWAAADLFDIIYAQSADVMTLCHPDYPPQELVRIDNDSWTLSEVDLTPDQASPTGIAVETNTTVTTGSITALTKANPAQVTASGHGLSTGDKVHIYGVGGMVEVNNFLYTVTVVNSNQFTIAYADSGTAVNSTGFTTYTSGGTFEKAVQPRQYAVTAISADDDEESLRGRCVLGDGTTTSLSITGISKANPAVVTTAEGHGFADLDEIEIDGVVGMTEINGRRFQVRFLTATTFSLRMLDGVPVDSTGFNTYTSGGNVYPLTISAHPSAASNWDNTISWATVDGALYYNVYATDTFGVLGFIGTTTKSAFEDKNIDPDYSQTPPRLYNPFDDFNDGTDRYPGSTGFFGQRRWFANSNTYPSRFWASQIGHFNNFSRSVPALDSDGIVASIAARRINDIKHIVPLTDLMLLTSGGEYRLTGGQNGVITPSTVSVRPQSYYGASKPRPIVAGDVALFVTPGTFVRDLTYQFADDKFVGMDITVLARHLFDYRTILDWDYASAPWALAFAVMSDGGGVFLTYQPEQKVYAWTRASTRGKYKSVTVVREGDEDVIYVLVERIISGNTVTFIERMDNAKFDDLQDAFCVDAGLTLDVPITITGATAADPVVITAPAHGLSNGDIVDISGVLEVSTTATTGEAASTDYNGTGFVVANVTTNTFELQNPAGTGYDGSGFAAYSSGGVVRKAVTTVSGLWHLEGATVVAAANGYAATGLTVTNGAVTLDSPASRVHIGLGYTCQLKTLPVSTYADGVTIQGKPKNIARLTVQVQRTMGLWQGPSEDELREVRFGMPALYGQPLEMRTEDIDVTMRADWSKRKQVVLEQRSPLPLTVLALIPDVVVGGT